MLVGFSCFCGFVCCKFQYINPCALPESLSAVSDTRYRSFALAGGWAKPLVPAMPSRIPPCPETPGLTCAKKSVALWLETSLSSPGPSQGSCLHLLEQHPCPSQAPELAHQGSNLERQLRHGGDGAGASWWSGWARGTAQAFGARGALGANQPVGGSGESPAGTAGIIGGSS